MQSQEGRIPGYAVGRFSYLMRAINITAPRSDELLTEMFKVRII